jgi:hypothetical protein
MHCTLTDLLLSSNVVANQPANKIPSAIEDRPNRTEYSGHESRISE